MNTGIELLQQETGDIVEQGGHLMGVRHYLLEGVSVGVRSLDDTLQLTHVGTCISKEAH